MSDGTNLDTAGGVGASGSPAPPTGGIPANLPRKVGDLPPEPCQGPGLLPHLYGWRPEQPDALIGAEGQERPWKMRHPEVDRERSPLTAVAVGGAGARMPTYRNPTWIRSMDLHENLPDLHERPVNLRTLLDICREMDDAPRIEHGGWKLAASRENGACQDRLRAEPDGTAGPRGTRSPPGGPGSTAAWTFAASRGRFPVLLVR